jgi:hypothetical protein
MNYVLIHKAEETKKKNYRTIVYFSFNSSIRSALINGFIFDSNLAICLL